MPSVFSASLVSGGQRCGDQSEKNDIGSISLNISFSAANGSCTYTHEKTRHRLTHIPSPEKQQPATHTQAARARFRHTDEGCQRLQHQLIHEGHVIARNASPALDKGDLRRLALIRRDCQHLLHTARTKAHEHHTLL